MSTQIARIGSIAIFFIATLLPIFVFAGSAYYGTPGTYTFNIPAYSTLTVELWGGGGGGGVLYYNGSAGDHGAGPGTASSFSGVAAGGGDAGYSGDYTYTMPPASGGTASGGDINTSGGTSPPSPYGGYSSDGGPGANGGAGGVGGDQMGWCIAHMPEIGYEANGRPGTAPGGAGGGADILVPVAGGGGGGAYAQRTYTAGAFTPGSQVSVVVGSAGAGAFTGYTGWCVGNWGYWYWIGGDGAPGAASITWTDAPPPPTASITSSAGNAIQVGQSTTITATYSPQSGDPITNTTINIGGASMIPYSSETTRTYTFTPSSPGDTTFLAYAQTASYPSWTVYNSVTISATNANCTFNGSTVANGSSVTAYQASTVPYGSSCVSQSRSCSNATLSGSFQYSSCFVAAASSCTFNGSSVNHGSSVLAYQAPTVPYGSSCVSQTRSCSNGTLSGTYAYGSCAVGLPTPPTCTLTPASQAVVSGSAASLSYTISGLVSTASINGAAVSPSASGIYTPAPGSTTSYTMTVSNTGGSTTCGPAIVTVNAPVGSGIPITGYAWSETVGWISLDGPNYGLLIGSGGVLNGFAWSENIGWVSANTNDLAGCPSAPCSATISQGGMSGWLKAIAADGSWDGWISLSGANYGVRLSGGTFSGFAWGSEVPGWIDFSNARTVYAQCGAFYGCSGSNVTYSDTDCTVSTVATCVAPMMCSAGVPTCQYPALTFVQGAGGITTGHLQLKPQVVRIGTSAKVYWNVANVATCSVSGSNGDSWVAAVSGVGGKATAPITQKVTYRLKCTALDGSVINETQSVNITPVFQER